LNDNLVGPRENAEMYEQYSPSTRYESTMYDGVQPTFDEVYKDCTQYDPTGYMQQWFALEHEIEMQTTLEFFSILANILPIEYTNLTLDGSTLCTSNVTECLWKFCDMRFGAVLNPLNDYMPYAGDYQTTKTFTMGHVSAPFCIQSKHQATIDRCASLWPKPPPPPPPLETDGNK